MARQTVEQWDAGYPRRLSGPLLDRIHIHIDVTRLSCEMPTVMPAGEAEVIAAPHVAEALQYGPREYE